MVEIEERVLERLRQRDRAFTRLKTELAKKGLIYTTCSGCGWAYADHPEVVLESVNGRDCGCPAGSGFAVRTPSRKRTPQEIEEWARERRDSRRSTTPDWNDGYAAAISELQAFLETRHMKKYKCPRCRDEKVLHDTPTLGIETPCPQCSGKDPH